ncbi:hypothetical protein ACFQ0B_32860 [Nonomuraea thailandensis]
MDHTAAPPVADTWQHVLLLHSLVEGRLATALQRRHGIGLSEFRALGHLAASPPPSCACRSWPTRSGSTRAR